MQEDRKRLMMKKKEQSGELINKWLTNLSQAVAIIKIECHLLSGNMKREIMQEGVGIKIQTGELIYSGALKI